MRANVQPYISRSVKNSRFVTQTSKIVKLTGDYEGKFAEQEKCEY